ncbi:hypothetical protein TL16_g03601 [Triparma laevis f. inornata]|uniref:UDENN domain-containing protein n=1 Tax=Triparma laevis f. inornata TaxID=1714386 RepID=A0A9W7E1P5_9STRA|nr:hypothetical protein TL16_g03601 [Triparma laevis f. inornata]
MSPFLTISLLLLKLCEYFSIVSCPILQAPSPSNRTPILLSDDEHTAESQDTNDTLEKVSEIFKPKVTARYPLSDYPDNPFMSEAMTTFSMPRGSEVKSRYLLPKIHHFVTTSEAGLKNYVMVVFEETTLPISSYFTFTPLSITSTSIESSSTSLPSDSLDQEPITVYVPKALILISLTPFLPTFRTYLSQLYRLSTTPTPLPLERYIRNITLEVPSPPIGTVEVQLSILDSVLRFWSPPANQPVAWVGLPFRLLFEFLRWKDIIVLWHALALERQVVLVSSQLSVLTVTSEILLSLLFPLTWTHCYIPLLPKFLFPVLSAPMPFLCGIDKRDLEEARGEINPECIIVDLDEGTVNFGAGTMPLPSLPNRRRYDDAFNLAVRPEDVRDEDEEEEGEGKDRGDWDAVQEAFLRFYVAMLKDYRNFIIFPSEDNPMGAGFKVKSFIKAQPKDFQPFLNELCVTQMFDAFITKRLYSPGEDDVTFFDESIDAKLNRYKLKLKKIETPFLQSAKVHRKLKTVVSPEPSGKDLPKDAGVLDKKTNERIFHYDHFPSTLNSELFGNPAPLPTVIEAENKKRISTARLRNHSSAAMPQATSNSSSFFSGSSLKKEESSPDASAESATFTVFFMAYTAVVGKGLKDLDEGKLPEGDSTRFNRPSSAEGEHEVESASSETSFVSAKSNQETESNESSTASKGRVVNKKSEVYEEAKATAKAQLDLAFKVLVMMRARGLQPESYAYQCLIDACGRCGDTERVCELLGLMHDDGVVADSVVYSCLVKAFSVDSSRDQKAAALLPKFANGYGGAIDWNKMRSMGGGSERGGSSAGQISPHRRASSAGSGGTPKSFMKKFFTSKNSGNAEGEEAFHLTESISRQNALGESLLELLYKDVAIDTSIAMCNVCDKALTEKDVSTGWNTGDAHDYCVTCKYCKGKGVTRFSVFSTNETWEGSGMEGKHEGKLFCEFLSPWVLRKELMSILDDGDDGGIAVLLDPNFPNVSKEKGTIFWNLLVSLRRERLPFTFLFQGSFGNSLITPTPDDGDDEGSNFGL